MLESIGPAGLDRTKASGPFHPLHSEHYDASWFDLYLRSFAGTIAGGTSQIQRNIVAERVLGLPR
jgi:alkylation response protein AidB-like acyl-CoA dehydrogenase